jgi:hypothetical protein
MHLNDGRVDSNIIVQALQGQDITIYCVGLEARILLYIRLNSKPYSHDE